MLGEAWALYKRYASHFILISFVIYLVIAVINALLSWALGTVGEFVGLILTVFGMFLLQAALVKAVQDVRDGRVDLDLRATVSAALPFVGSVAVASILASIGIGIGFVLIIVPGLILVTFWSLIVPEIVIGGAGALESFGRSWRTVRGYAWNVFGTIILVFLIQIAARIVLSVIFFALPYGWRSFIADLVTGTLIAPFLAAVVTLTYYRLTAAHGEQEPSAGHGIPYAARPRRPVRAAARRAAFVRAAAIGTARTQPPSSEPPSSEPPAYGRPPSEPPRTGRSRAVAAGSPRNASSGCTCSAANRMKASGSWSSGAGWSTTLSAPAAAQKRTASATAPASPGDGGGAARRMASSRRAASGPVTAIR